MPKYLRTSNSSLVYLHIAHNILNVMTEMKIASRVIITSLQFCFAVRKVNFAIQHGVRLALYNMRLGLRN